MKSASLFLLLGFFAIAVFGVFAAGGDHRGCIVATANGVACPNEDPVLSIAFHLNAVKGFALATYVALTILVLAITFLFAFRYQDEEKFYAGLRTASNFLQPNLFYELRSSYLGKIFYWLALEKNSQNI